MSPFYQEQRVQLCDLSSLIYYGGQDIYSQPQTTQGSGYSTFNQDGVEDDSGSASRGNWWQGLKQCGKSCKLRWLDYLRPDIKRGLVALAIVASLGALPHTLGILVPVIGASVFATATTAIGTVSGSFR